MTIQNIIKNSIKALQQRDETLTPENYANAFCKEAKKHGVVVDDCMKVDKFIKRLNPKYQRELYSRNIQTLDELFTFLTTVLNRFDKEESAAVIKAYTLLIRRVVQAASLLKNKEVERLAHESLELLDPHMKVSEIERLRTKWNDFVIGYDDSFLEPLSQYTPVKKTDLRQMVQNLLPKLEQPSAKEGFAMIAEVVVASLVPSIANSANDSIAKLSSEIRKKPENLTTKGMLEDVKEMVKLRIELDKKQIKKEITSLNEIIETLSMKLHMLVLSSDRSSSKIKDIKGQLEDIDPQEQDFDKLHDKLLGLVNSLEEETESFFADIKSKDEEVHNLKNRVQLLEKALKIEQEKSHTDSLTKLPNRRAGDEKLEELEADFQRHGKNFAVALFDIDFFKKINDTYGHDAGDVILASLGKVLKRYKRQNDLVCRLGGEEFMAVLPFTDRDEAYSFAQKVREAIEKSKFMYKGTRIEVTVSGGVAARDREKSVPNMLKIADKLLYKAKNNGRNKIEK